MARIGQRDEAAEAQDALLGHFVDHIVKLVALGNTPAQFGGTSANIDIERRLAIRAIKDALAMQRTPRY